MEIGIFSVKCNSLMRICTQLLEKELFFRYQLSTLFEAFYELRCLKITLFLCVQIRIKTKTKTLDQEPSQTYIVV